MLLAVLVILSINMAIQAKQMVFQAKQIAACMKHIETILLKRNKKIHEEPLTYQDPNGPKLPVVVKDKFRTMKSFGEYQPLEPHKKGEEHE